jgi:subtilase family serine protease
MQIDFSGTAGQVNRSFHTQENLYRLGNENYFANSGDISIPAALREVVAGVAGLNNLHASARKEPQPHKRSRPPLGQAINFGGARALVPNDLATIYGVTRLRTNGVTGTGVTIAVVGHANMVKDDWTNFTQFFNLARFGGTFNLAHPAPVSGTNNCEDPDAAGGPLAPARDDATTLESAEWATALAPGANIVVASCANVVGEPWLGTIIAGSNLINGSNRPDIITVGETQDERWDAAGKTTIDQMWQQADAEGISVFAASGDKGVTPENFSGFSPVSGSGLGVNAFATSPHVTAVGGTDFSDAYDGTSSRYFLSSPSVVGGSAISYVPEIPWNESCGNGVFGKMHGYNRVIGFCNDMIRNVDVTLYDPRGEDWSDNGIFVTFRASSGGPSSVDSKPSWQGNVNNASADGRRDIPDVALFAGSIADYTWLTVCSQAYACSADFNYPYAPAAGTALSAAMFAGIQAVMDQGLNDRNLGKDQGNAAPTLYALAAKEYGGVSTPAPASLATCSSDNTTGTAANCIFHNITRGSTSTNCVIPASWATSIPNCYVFNNWTVQVLNAGQPKPFTLLVGLSTSDVSPTGYTVQNKAYTARPGWSFASGLGSVNATNLLIAWRAYNTANKVSSTH